MKAQFRRVLTFYRTFVVAALGLFTVLEVDAGTFIGLNPMNDAREFNTATLLPNGQVLVAGGQGMNGYLSSAELYNPATGVWSYTGSLNTAREYQTGTLLTNGLVLIAGGYGSGSPGYLAAAELYNPVTGNWAVTSSLNISRDGHTATLLGDGRVLIAGGYNSDSGFLTSVELYDPTAGSWAITGSLNFARVHHSATLLADGKVLVAGGNDGTSPFVLSNSELYDPGTGKWTVTTGAMSTARFGHTATLLPGGQVLVTGGEGVAGEIASTELFDPVSGAWSSGGTLNVARESHTASLLPNGEILVVGGYNAMELEIDSAELYNPATKTWTISATLGVPHNSQTATILASGQVLVAGGDDMLGVISDAELFDPTGSPATGTWTNTGTLNLARAAAAATLLPNGQVLVAGGQGAGNYRSAELYIPTAGTWSNTGPLNVGREDFKMTLLANGNVMAAGGIGASNNYLASAELYDPASGTWTVTDSMNVARGFYTSTLLPSGKVLAVGGISSTIDQGTTNLQSAEIYDPIAAKWSAASSMNTARSGHAAALLPTGNVLIVGGGNEAGVVSTAEIFDPISGNWKFTGSLNTGRSDHTATLLPNGKVLVAGGSDNTGTAYASSELYDPSTEIWTLTGSLNMARAGHTASLMPNGKVLVTGGYYFTNGDFLPISTTEIYDPVTGTWTSASSLSTAVFYQTATLLPNGRLLIAGGYQNPTNVIVTNPLSATAQLFDIGLGYSNSWQPQILSASSPVNVLDGLTLSGSQFRGISEGSDGNGSQDSAADYPLVQLRSIESGQSVFLSPTNWSANSFASLPISYFPAGYALVTVFVNGIPSTSSIVLVPPPPAFQTTSKAGGNLSFTWSGQVGFSYQVQYKTNMVSSNWTNLGGPIVATNVLMSGSDAVNPGAAAKLYRIALVP